MDNLVVRGIKALSACKKIPPSGRAVLLCPNGGGAVGKCAALIKAIDAYIAKVDGDLENALEAAGFADCADTVAEISSLEHMLARALTAQSQRTLARLQESVDLAEFSEGWSGFAAADTTDKALAGLFYASFTANMPKLATSYIKQIDPALTVATIGKRTTAWAQEWSAELGRLMKDTTNGMVGRMLANHLFYGGTVASLTRALQESGIRDEYKRARAAALTETLRVHSVAQQEAITQNPAVEDKMWKHTGGHRNKPRENHVDMDGDVVRKDQPFTLEGADGNVYHPMYPRDSILPAGESVNCHCIHQGIVNEDVLGLSLEERQELQRRAIDEDDGVWERRLRWEHRLGIAGIE